FLEQHGLDLDIRNVLANKKDMDQMMEISGQTMTPTFQYGDFVVADFSVDEFMSEISEFPELQAELGIGDDE
ncbi:MAG TPA: hypothetical protein PKX94_08910, partial [Opitutales bacterium]|nr:hypothetical protein [Opitutales bacterium]